MNQIVLNELELRNVIRRRILREEMNLLNEAGTGAVSVITDLEGIASGGEGLDNGAKTVALEAGAAALGGFAAIPDWAQAAGLAGLSFYFTGNPFTGLAAYPFVAGSLVTAQKYIDNNIAQAKADSANDDLSALDNFFHQKASVDFAADLEDKIGKESIIFPAIVEDDNGEPIFEVDGNGEVVKSFLGLESSSFQVLLESGTSQDSGDLMSNFFESNPSEKSKEDITAKVKEIFENKDVSLSEFAHIDQIVYDKRGDYDFEGTWTATDDYAITRSKFESLYDEGGSSTGILLGFIGDENNTKYPDDETFLSSLNPVKNKILPQKIENNVFKIYLGATGFNKMKASLAFYDSGGKGWRETADGDITIGQAFFKEALKTKTFREIKNRLEKVKQIAKAATSALIDMIPEEIRSEEIDTILTELQGVMDDESSTSLQCAAAIMLALLKIGKEGLTAVMTKAAELGGDLLDFFGLGDEDDGGSSSTSTTSGSTASASSKRATTGTRANTERIQKLLNQYWTKEGLTSPDVALEEDGKWGDLTDYMWFAVLEHASNSNSWYKTTTTSAGKDNAGWPATAASLRESDNETFDGKTTGCIQFLEKLLGEDSGAGTPTVNTTPEPDDNLGTTTQQQPREEATGMQGLIKVVGTGMNDVMYLEDIGYSEGTSETLARDIINAADRGYTGSGEPLNFVIEIFRKSDSNDYRKVKISRSKGESRRDLRGVEKIPNVIKNFFEKKKPDFDNDNFQNTIRRSRRTVDIHEFSLAITVPG